MFSATPLAILASRDVELEISLLDQRPPQLSGGQLQRVCLARALATRPTLLILDEAVSSLDLVLQAGIIRLLKKLQQHSGIACLFITHDLRLVERFCQRVVVMEDGHISEDIAVTHPLRFTSLAGQALQQAVEGTVDCVEINWTLFDLSIPEWSLLAFVAFSLFALIQFFRRG